MEKITIEMSFFSFLATIKGTVSVISYAPSLKMTMPDLQRYP